ENQRRWSEVTDPESPGTTRRETADALDRRQARRDQASVLRDLAADDRAGLRESPRSPQVDGKRGRTRARCRLHGGAGRDATGLAPRASTKETEMPIPERELELPPRGAGSHFLPRCNAERVGNVSIDRKLGEIPIVQTSHEIHREGDRG